MPKTKIKFIIALFVLSFVLFNTLCFATENNEIILISEENSKEQLNVQNNTEYSNLYISQDGEYSIKNTISGSVFASVEDFTIDPSNNGGKIIGNLYVKADTVNIKSNFKYSKAEKDNLGNAKLESVTNFSIIDGNAFVITNKFVLEPNCTINGDLYLCANEIELSQSAVINGNVFIIGNTLDFNCKISGGDLYANVKNFNMKYYGFIDRDLILSAENVFLEGYIYRNSFIDAKNITLTSTFINNKDLNIENATNVMFSGTVKENANIKSKNINFKFKDDNNKNITCSILGNLNYASLSELQIEDKIVVGNTTYSKYSNNILSHIGIYLLELITSLIYVTIVYLILNKFAPKFTKKLSSTNSYSILKVLGVGILFFIILPILSLILIVTQIGSLLGLLIAIVYALLLIIAKPLTIIVISKIINNKIKSINIYITIAITTIALSLINLIPYVGFIVSLLVLIMGLGLIVKCIK